MSPKEEVLNKIPKAYVHTFGSKKEICRPREKTDPPAIVKYVLLSGTHWREDYAWEDAAKKLQNSDT